MNKTAFKVVKIVVAAIGIGVNIASNVMEERSRKNQIAEEVKKALRNR